jgi:hypothetical protein
MTDKTKLPTAKSSSAPVEKKPRPVPAAKAATPTKPSAKAATQKPVAASVVPKSNATKAEKPPKEDKPKKIKMVRDSFTMPESEYAKIDELKKKCLQAGVHVKKSELLRAGLLNLSKLSDADLISTMDQVETLKTGRPAKA